MGDRVAREIKYQKSKCKTTKQKSKVELTASAGFGIVCRK